MARSNLPSIRLVSWNTELGVGVIFTATLLAANRPLSCAAQIGQLKPPGNTISSIGLSWAKAGSASPVARTSAATRRRIGILLFLLVPTLAENAGQRAGDRRW